MNKLIRGSTLLFLLLALMISASPPAGADQPPNPYYRVYPAGTLDGEEIELIVISGPPEPPAGFIEPAVQLAAPSEQDGRVIITSVPAFNWSFGCSATSAAMIAGYYDRDGYPNMYAGPTHGGLMPMDNSYWDDWVDSHPDVRHQCPLSATHYGLDGRTELGHVDDYWVYYLSGAPDPYITESRTQHAYADCTGDYMGTNQSALGSDDGSTTFYFYPSGNQLHCDALATMLTEGTYDGTIGLRDFYEARGYTVTDCFYQLTDNAGTSGGFTFAQYVAEIDAGRPVMIHVEGHTMVGFGYDEATDLVYLHNTWDYNSYTMTWGGSYSGMSMVGVSIVHLDPHGVHSAGTGDWNNTATWGGAVPGITEDVIIGSGHTVTAVGSVQVANLTIEYGATLVIPSSADVSVEGTLANNGALQQTRNVPASPEMAFLRITNAAGDVVKYHGVDIDPDSAAMGSTTVTIQGNHTGGCTTASEDALLYRCFEISPESPASATVRFWYDEDERNGQDASDLAVWHNDGGSSWTKVGSYTHSEASPRCETGDGTACWVEAAGITAYSVFDIGNADEEPTAFRLRDLAARAAGGPPVAALGGLLAAAVATAVLLGIGRRAERRTHP